jgi:hypothetical protein
MVTACGGQEREMSVQQVDRVQREARVRLTPAIDFSNLFDAALADRIVIEEITINVANIRVLGASPAIPADGLSLSQSEVLLFSSTPALELPLPEELVDDELSVQVEVRPTEALEGASVVVKGVLYSGMVGTSARGLALDPDGEPADKGGEQNVDPDGEPADKGGEQNVDPDGEPAACAEEGIRCATLQSSGQFSRTVPFELRAADLAKLLVEFDAESSFDVVLGIPAARWLTEEVVAELERKSLSSLGMAEDREQLAREAIIIEDEHRVSEVEREAGDGIGGSDELGDSDYRLHRGGEVDPTRIRQR